MLAWTACLPPFTCQGPGWQCQSCDPAGEDNIPGAGGTTRWVEPGYQKGLCVRGGAFLFQQVYFCGFLLQRTLPECSPLKMGKRTPEMLPRTGVQGPPRQAV